MNTFPKVRCLTALKRFIQASSTRSLILALAISAPLTSNAADTGKTFATPEAAVAALAAAAGADDAQTFRDLFGPAVEDLVNPDRVQAANENRAFLSALTETNRLVHQSDSRCVLEVGGDSWAFPVPLAKKDGRWFFDTAAGKEELLNRRIGRNELSTLATVRAYVEAQRVYAGRDRDGDQVLEFAQKFVSTAGLKDGLFWPFDLDGEFSPLGPLVADAAAEGYRRTGSGTVNQPEAFHGYRFKILTRQGRNAPGGKHDYVVNGNMIGGFALVAWPAEYGESGIMTFIVNQQGQVYQQDLGPKTARKVAGIKRYDLDKSWEVSPD